MILNMSKDSKNFDVVYDSFKDIYTKKGIDEKKLLKFIEDSFDLLPSDKQSAFAANIIMSTVCHCTKTFDEYIRIIRWCVQVGKTAFGIEKGIGECLEDKN
jgi:hypothetical protein